MSDFNAIDLTTLLEIAAQAEPRPRIIVGFPFIGNDFIALHDRPDKQRLLLIGRGAYEKLHSRIDVRVLQNASEWVDGIEVEFWNWTQHRDITRAVFEDLGYGPVHVGIPSTWGFREPETAPRFLLPKPII